MDLTKARDSSLVAKWLAVVVLIAGLVSIGFRWISLPVMELILGSLAIPVIFSDVGLNLMIEKITGRKGGE